MSFKTLIIDGDWNLKRNFEKRNTLFSNGEHCGGSYGFLESLRASINKVMPDRVVVMWDGVMGGKMRHDMYPQYKANRDKSWDEDSYIMTEELLDIEKKRKYSILQQKIKVKNYLEELFIRQAEIDHIEGDDLIGYYILTKKDNEEVVIFSSDKDYMHLIDKNVSLLRGNNYEIIDINNFKNKYGYIHENSLILKCFEGDVSDNVSGIDGIAFKSLIKHFPDFENEPYDINRFIIEAVEKYKIKQLKIFEKIIGSRKTIERNIKLFNLKSPMINDQVKEEIDIMHNAVLVEDENFTDRSVYNAMKMMLKDGYNMLVWKEDMDLFFRPFYFLVTKEKEYAKNKIL